MATRLYLLAGLASVLLVGCAAGYKKVDGKWKYVTNDENSGTVMHPIGADENSMIVLHGGYAKDKNHVYFNGRVIEGADVATFEPISGTRFAKDKTHVYVTSPEPENATCAMIVGADPLSFKLIKLPYSRDQTRVYCGTVPMNVANKAAFEVLPGSDMWSSTFDKRSFLFQYGDEFKDLDISQAHPAMTGNGAWARDGQHYYYGPARIEQADYASFKIIDGFNSADKNRKYMFCFPADEAAARRQRYQNIK